MEIISENTVRKVDSLGRIGVPKGIRNRMRIGVNQEMEFFTARDADGKEYVLFSPVNREDDIEEKYIMAADLLTEFGVEIPKEILEHI